MAMERGSIMYKDFYKIVEDILSNTEFKKLKKESHHGTNRYIHSLRVAMGVYNISKNLNSKYVDITRAALLHDFFQDAQINSRMLKIAFEHPIRAYENASKYFNLTKMQENIIKCHMFPLAIEVPKSFGAVIITLVDKKVAIYEYSNYKFNPNNLKNIVLEIPFSLKNRNIM